ncbi:MAG: hypothetical protein J6S13_09145 [Clostridia bacterium]|nr:hypothetical protein [Clostridia bacterium]
MTKRILALILALLLGLCLCACDGDNTGNTDGKTDSSVVSGSSDTASNDTASTDISDATLTIKVKKGEVTKFKSNRPYDDSKEDITIILVTGQSNFTTSVGFSSEYGGVANGKIANFSEVPVIPEKGTCYSSGYRSAITVLSDDRDMNKLCDASRLDNTLGGVSPSFGIEWNKLTGTKVVFVQAAVGAVGVHEWTPNPDDYICECNSNTQLYAKAVEIYKSSYNALSKNYNIVYTGYIWNQGEHEEVYGKPECQSTVNSDQGYYDAYKSMHYGFMSELGLDFGGISVVRADKAGATAQGSMSLTIARNAQYKLCNDIDNLFMISTMSETCAASAPLDMDKTNTIHYSQATFNKMGADCASNLYKYLGLADQNAQFGGIEVYSSVAHKLAAFDKDGKAIGEAVVAKGLFTNHILAKLSTLGTNYRINGFSLIAADGTDLSSHVDDFGAIDWTAASSGRTIKNIEVKCVIE